MEIEYHPQNGKTVLKEAIVIRISPLQRNGTVCIEYDKYLDCLKR